MPPSSLVITEELLISLPAAAIVSTTPTGSADSGVLFLSYKSHTSKSAAAPYAIAFAESITLPPPTASMKSTPLDFASSMPS